jgi:4-diphosphocytidyl-2-C-methyl-D-erythritol kinase
MPVLDKQMTVFAPAKVNLHLAVGERRSDGFHNLESIFLKADFGDTLNFLHVDDQNSIKIVMEFGEDACFSGNSSLIDIPQEENIIYKAVSLFRSKTGFCQGLIIKTEKRIPAGGGLGGGSSDAACTLLALNQIAGSPLNFNKLLELAAALGSDVPFFIHKTSAALVTGRGECIKPLKTPRLFLTLVNPGFPSDTASAFRLLDNYRLQASGGNTASIEETPPFTGQRNASLRLRKKDFSNMYNDFLPVFPEREKSMYNGIIAQLMELGACFSSLSGSGSTCFGIFNRKDQAENAALVLGKKWKFVRVCKTLLK